MKILGDNPFVDKISEADANQEDAHSPMVGKEVIEISKVYTSNSSVSGGNTPLQFRSSQGAGLTPQTSKTNDLHWRNAFSSPLNSNSQV